MWRTCFHTGQTHWTFDLDICVCFHLLLLFSKYVKHVFLHRGLDLRPTTQTLTLVTSWPLWPAWKSRFLTWWPWPLTYMYDLDLHTWTRYHQSPSLYTCTKFDHPRSNSSGDINFYLVIFVPMNYFLVTDRQTDRRRRTRAHRAWAQVGSKMEEFASLVIGYTFDTWPPDLTAWTSIFRHYAHFIWY